MQKTCKKCSQTFEITNSDLEFYKKISPKFGDKIFEIPAPTLCPDCRQQRRLAFRNERKLYKRKCDATGENIISIYSPDKPFKVYEQDFWWSDKWNPLDYGRDFDFSRSFFEQFRELLKDVPQISLLNKMSENSQYCNHATHCKNCYLIFGSADVENCLYSNRTTKSNNIIDSSNVSNSQKIFYSIDIEDSYNLFYCINCKNSTNSKYLKNCEGCSFCYSCNNLINKQYCIENRQYTKEEYFNRV